MNEALSNLFSSDFIPHGSCFRWIPEILWLHVGSDFFIATSYYFIPVCLIGIALKRGDLRFNWMFMLFAAFIFLCGTTHLISIWTMWNGSYGVEGVAKLLTALVSFLTAALLFKITPELLSAPPVSKLLNASENFQQSENELNIQAAKSEQLFHLLKSILDNTSSVVFVKGLDGCYQFVNKQYEKLFKISNQDIQGKQDSDIFPQEVADNFRQNDLRVIETNQVHEVEELVPCDDGVHTYLSIKFPIRGSQDQIVGLGGIATDITQLKKTNDELQRAHKFVNSIIENIPSMVFLKDAKELRFVRFNKAGEELLGISRAELLGKNDFDLFPNEQAQFFFDSDRRVLNEIKTLDIEEEPLLTKSGMKFLHTKKIAIVDDNGIASHLLGISEDVTARKQMQDAIHAARLDLEQRVELRTKELAEVNKELQKKIAQLVEAEDFFRIAVQASTQAFVMVDGTGQIVLVNKAAQDMFGYSEEELLNSTVENLIPERFRENHCGLRGEYNRSPSPRPMGHGRYLLGKRKDGHEFPVEVGIGPIKTNSGLFLLSTIVDITARKHAEDELLRSNRDLDQFAYVASHDLNSPLRAIDNLAQWIAEDLGDNCPDHVQNHITLMRQRVKRMEGLLESLLQYSRIGRKTYELTELDSQTLIEDIVDFLAPPKDFTVSIDCKTRSITLPRVPFELVVRNLISNSFKHASRDNGHVHVAINDIGSQIELIVKDDGPGIPKEFSTRVFEMFQTLKPRDEVEGSGMGLAIVKKTVESFGGSISLNSEAGKGCTFTVNWPKQTHQ